MRTIPLGRRGWGESPEEFTQRMMNETGGRPVVIVSNFKAYGPFEDASEAVRYSARNNIRMFTVHPLYPPAKEDNQLQMVFQF